MTKRSEFGFQHADVATHEVDGFGAIGLNDQQAARIRADKAQGHVAQLGRGERDFKPRPAGRGQPVQDLSADGLRGLEARGWARSRQKGGGARGIGPRRRRDGQDAKVGSLH